MHYVLFSPIKQSPKYNLQVYPFWMTSLQYFHVKTNDEKLLLIGNLWKYRKIIIEHLENYSKSLQRLNNEQCHFFVFLYFLIPKQGIECHNLVLFWDYFWYSKGNFKTGFSHILFVMANDIWENSFAVGSKIRQLKLFFYYYFPYSRGQ